MKGIDVRCHKCGVTVKVSIEKAGYTANCSNCGAVIDVPLPGVAEGKDYGDFLLKRRLGRGGMGEVWLAEQKAMARLAALKILPPAMAQDDDYRERFLREARIAGKLHHPNIATAFSAGMVNGLYFLASRYIEGVNLADLQKAGQEFGEKDILAKVIQIADALDYAWNEYNIIHRDIKPENIMIGDSGKPVLLDLGIAKQIGGDAPGLTQVGIIIGTPDYISPEQANGTSDIDFRTDIYSLGATIYHLLTGEAPFGTGVAQVILGRVLTDPLKAPDLVNPAISPATSALIIKMMAKDREARQQSWKEVVDDVQKAINGVAPVVNTKILMPDAADYDKLDDIDINILRKIGNQNAKANKAVQPEPDIDVEDTIEMEPSETEEKVVLRLKQPGSIISGNSEFSGPVVPPEMIASSRFAFLENRTTLIFILIAAVCILVGVTVLVVALTR